MKKGKSVRVAHADLLAAWTVLENLAVSLDQIGGVYGVSHNGKNGAALNRAFQAALVDYLNPRLVRAIRHARARLGRYVSDADAEKTSASIPYWDYQANLVRTGRR
jgi:hypothetical protein